MQPPVFEPGPDAHVMPDSTIADWDLMFRAVLHRLRRIGSSEARARRHPSAVAAPDLAAVLDCVAALEQLHQTLAAERMQRKPLEAAVPGAGPA